MGDTTTPAVERELAFDMLRRGLPAAPVVVLLAAAVWGTAGAWSAAYGIAIVAANLALSALSLTWAARISLTMIMVTAMLGFLVRMALVTVAIVLVKDEAWVSLPALGATVVVTQLGLLFWETRYVSASLAFPGLKPVTRKEARSS
jgi:hypothetical protein